ncbi:MAG: FKBP-type peptidyl-prolyl cis-trans isomerase [Gammaproteobacteria bacterium]
MIIEENKYVELTYRIVDEASGESLKHIEYPLGYVHGANEILSEPVMQALQGHTAGDVIEIPIDCTQLYGERDEGLVFTDAIENVPEEYREVGTVIVMENEQGDPREFIVTRMDDKTLTVDGNNPLCGRQVIFRVEILKVRDATPDEIENGGAQDPHLDEILAQTKGG